MQYVTVATTRPETMLGDTAVAINPKDPRAAALRGKSVRLPIVNRIIPIIEDDYVVLPDPTSSDAKAQFATGFLKVTPAHDPNDYDIGLRHKLPVINVLAPDGTISDQHGWPKEDVEAGDAEFLLGQDRFEARAAVVEWFRKNDLLEEVKPYRHSVGHSYRSHVPIEPYLSDQWYCKVTDDRLAGAALRAMNTEQVDSRGTGASPVSAAQPQIDSRSAGTHGRGAHATKDWHGNLKFYPARYAKTFQTWHENIRDWCISRQLWWGHRIPVWSFKHDAAVDSKKDEHLASLIEKVLQLRGAGRIAIHTPARESDKSAIDLQHAFICVRTEGDAEAIKALEELGFAQDPDVLDTWFSSGLWPMSTLGWPEMTPALAKWNPTHTLSTDRGIITLWVGRMVMFNLYFLDRLPFTEVFIHATVLDDKGRKMSKSLGNGVDPLDIIESHGADAMRFTLTLMTTQTQDVRMPVEKDAKSGKNTSPKFDIGRNFCNKLWNAARFAMMSLAPSPLQGEGGDEGRSAASSSGAGSPNVSPLTPALSPRGEREQGSLADRWIISRFNRTVASCEASLREYRFDQYAKTCYDFFWGDFCDWYLEAIKPAMKDPARAAATANVLASILDGALRLLHPMIPFITETIWWKLNEVRPNRGLPGQLECAPNPRLIKAAWPKITATDDAAEATFAKLQEVIGALRNLRNQHKVDPKRTITVTISAPDDAGRQIEANRELVELLAICQIKQIGENLAGSEKAARASAGTIAMFVEGMADEAAEQQRTAKRCEELKKQIAALRGRLSNEAYIKKAPPKLVDETKQQLADAEAEAAKLGCK
jgi:valyl-tRNA synthetase